MDLEGPQKVAPEAPDTPKMAIFGAFGALVPLYGGPKGPKAGMHGAAFFCFWAGRGKGQPGRGGVKIA